MGAVASKAGKTRQPMQQLENTLDLVLHTIPIVTELCGMLRTQFTKKDQRWDYVNNVKTSMGILERYLRDIGEQGDVAAFERQIKDLADYLDQIFCFAPSQTFEHSRLQAARIAWAEGGRQHTPENFLDSESIGSRNKWDSLQCKLQYLVKELESYGADTDYSEEGDPLRVLETDPDMWAFADRVFNAMNCQCHAASQKKMRLKIGTYKPKSLTKTNSLCILLADGKKWPDSHEMFIHDHPEPKPKAKFTTENQAVEAIKWETTSEAVNCVHTAVKDFPAGLLRFDFILRSDLLYQSHKFGDKRMLSPHSLKEEISLKSLISSPHPQMVNWFLAVILSHNLHHLYGGSWTQNGWSRDNIFFFKNGSRIPLRPFLGLSLRERDHHEKQQITTHHRYPEILELGVILLELNMGQRMEEFLGLREEITDIRKLYAHAIVVFSEREREIVPCEYRQAIKICLWPDVELQSTSNEGLRTMLLYRVVAPLEQFFNTNFRQWLCGNDIDEQAAEFNLVYDRGLSEVPEPTGEPLKRRETSENDNRPLLQGAQPHATLHSSKIRSGSHPQYGDTRNESVSDARARNGKDTEPRTKSELFDGKECTSSSQQRKSTDQWKKAFKKLVKEHVESQSDRLKVAILDTGIADHFDFHEEERILDKKSWIEDPKYIDESGHGTHIVGTLLEMTQNVDVYVGRISKSSCVPETNHIAEAIKHARDIQKVDIISLSFGFPFPIQPIQREIKKSIDQGILVFAAASNDGGNSSRAFPACQEGVFCIHSAKSNGANASYNPSPQPRGDNFSFVGNSLKSSWLNGERKYMSGTSFATPVAVSVVALMYGFICKEIPLHYDFPIPAKSTEGMRKVLRLMKNEMVNGYDWISPLFFFDTYSKEKIVADIKHVLSK